MQKNGGEIDRRFGTPAVFLLPPGNPQERLFSQNREKLEKCLKKTTPDLLIPSNNKFDPLPSFLLFAKQQVCRITPDIVVFQSPGSTEKQLI